MTNPVDDAPVGQGKIALPLDPADTQPSGNAGARLRKFRRLAICVLAVCSTLVLVAFWENPSSVGKPIDELAVNIAEDPRLEVSADCFLTIQC